MSRTYETMRSGAAVGGTLVQLGYDTYGRLIQRKRLRTMPSSYVKKSRKPSSTSYKKKVATSGGKVKEELLRMATRYHSSVPDTTGGVFGMTQNTLYALNLTGKIRQGTDNTSRQGDACFLEGLTLRGFFNTASASNAYVFRVMVVWSGADYANTNMSSSSLTYPEVFLPSTGFTSITNAIVNPKAVTVLYDNTIDLNSQVANSPDVMSVLATCKLDQKFQFKSDSSVFGKTKNLYLVIGGFGIGQAALTPVGSGQFATDIRFKNL